MKDWYASSLISPSLSFVDLFSSFVLLFIFVFVGGLHVPRAYASLSFVSTVAAFSSVGGNVRSRRAPQSAEA